MPRSTSNDTPRTAREPAAVGLGEVADLQRPRRRDVGGVRAPVAVASERPRRGGRAPAPAAAQPGRHRREQRRGQHPGDAEQRPERHGVRGDGLAGHDRDDERRARAVAEPDPPGRRGGGAGVALVRGAERHHQPVARLDRRDDAGQRDRDPRGGPVGRDGHPARGDGAAEQRPGAVRGDLVDLAEQHRLVRRGLARHPGDREVDPRRAGHEQRGGDGGGAERGGLPGQLRGERGDAAADGAQRAAEPGQRGDRGGVAARAGPARPAARPSSGSGCGGHGRGTGEAGVGGRLDGAAGGRVAARAHAARDRVAEARARVAALRRRASGRTSRRSRRGRAGPAPPPSWPAAVPEHPHRAAGRGDLPGGGVGLVQPEQRVRLALHDERRSGDPVRDRGGGGAAQELRGGGGEPSGGGGLGVGRADGGVKRPQVSGRPGCRCAPAGPAAVRRARSRRPARRRPRPPRRGPPPGARPAEKNTPAQPRLNTPSGEKAPRAGVSAGSDPGAAAAFGNSAWPRSFHVITGATRRSARSYPASSSASAPPYDPPVTPTRGSPGPSCTTSGRAASRSTSARASATSKSGESSAICPPLAPKPRAVHVERRRTRGRRARGRRRRPTPSCRRSRARPARRAPGVVARQVQGGVEGDRAGQPGARGDLDLLLDGPGPRGGGRRSRRPPARAGPQRAPRP